MTLEELKRKESYEIKLGHGSPQTQQDGSIEFIVSANVQILDQERKVQLKSIAGVIGTGASKVEAENNAISRACELLGEA